MNLNTIADIARKGIDIDLIVSSKGFGVVITNSTVSTANTVINIAVMAGEIEVVKDNAMYSIANNTIRAKNSNNHFTKEWVDSNRCHSSDHPIGDHLIKLNN